MRWKLIFFGIGYLVGAMVVTALFTLYVVGVIGNIGMLLVIPASVGAGLCAIGYSWGIDVEA